MDHNPSGRRPHYHRGRRGMDRRGSDRRTPQQNSEQSGRVSGDQVDVEQIMREIRARISQRHGIELSPQQIEDLAARRLEAILDPRTVSPTLIDQLRKGASAVPDPLPASSDGNYSFSETAIYETDNGLVRFFRRLLNPLLKLFFNPAPIVTALQAQAGINRDAAARAAEAERRQAEWNALHYQILQRLVTEVSRVSIEMQALNARVESLGGRVDYNDRRMRSFEAAVSGRNPRPEVAPAASAPAENAAPTTEAAAPQTAAAGPSDGSRRRRRRRRGRRGSMSPAEPAAVMPGAVGEPANDVADVDMEAEEGEEEEAPAEQAATTEAAPPTPPADEPVLPPSPQPVEFSFTLPPAGPPDETPPVIAPSEPTDPGRSES